MGVRENHRAKGLTLRADDLVGVCNIRSLERSLVRNGATGSHHHLSGIKSYKCLHGCCIGIEIVCADHMHEM